MRKLLLLGFGLLLLLPLAFAAVKPPGSILSLGSGGSGINYSLTADYIPFWNGTALVDSGAHGGSDGKISIGTTANSYGSMLTVDGGYSYFDDHIAVQGAPSSSYELYVSGAGLAFISGRLYMGAADTKARIVTSNLHYGSYLTDNFFGWKMKNSGSTTWVGLRENAGEFQVYTDSGVEELTMEADGDFSFNSYVGVNGISPSYSLTTDEFGTDTQLLTSGSSYSVVDGDFTIVVDSCGSGFFYVYLPRVEKGRIIVVKNRVSGGCNVYVRPYSGELIDEGTTYALISSYRESITVQGSTQVSPKNWDIISDAFGPAVIV